MKFIYFTLFSTNKYCMFYTVRLNYHSLHIFLSTYTSGSYHDVIKFSSAFETITKMRSITSFVNFDRAEFDCYTKLKKWHIALFISRKVDSYSSFM